MRPSSAHDVIPLFCPRLSRLLPAGQNMVMKTPSRAASGPLLTRSVIFYNEVVPPHLCRRLPITGHHIESGGSRQISPAASRSNIRIWGGECKRCDTCKHIFLLMINKDKTGRARPHPHTYLKFWLWNSNTTSLIPNTLWKIHTFW